jgi:hypothetical protein
MNCEQARELLGPASDNELANESAAMVAGHISKCDQCQAQWEQILSVRAGIGNILAEQKPDADFEKRIISALHQDQKNNRRRYFSAYLVGAAATLLLVSLTIPTFLSWFRSPLSSLGNSIAAESLVASIGHHSSGPEDSNYVVNYVGKKDAVDLTPKVGFAVQKITIGNYLLFGSDIVKTAQGKTLVRMCYSCTDGSSTDCIDCYQAPTGLLALQKTSMRQVVLLDGQIANVGKIGGQSALLLSVKGTDVLYVSPISSEKLIKLVAPTT